MTVAKTYCTSCTDIAHKNIAHEAELSRMIKSSCNLEPRALSLAVFVSLTASGKKVLDLKLCSLHKGKWEEHILHPGHKDGKPTQLTPPCINRALPHSLVIKTQLSDCKCCLFIYKESLCIQTGG